MQSASDAFGLTIGTQSIGLYSQNSVRGFSPIQAGNMRINGLYFDRQAIGTKMVRATTIYVGLSAQSYPFPAPTGIADLQLRVPGSKTITTLSSNYESYGIRTPSVSLDVSWPVAPGVLGVMGGATLGAWA